MYFTVEPAPNQPLPLYKTILCVTCALLLILNGFSLYHNLESLKGTNALLTKSARVADRLEYLNVLVLDTESSLRGYYISGSETYLGPSKTAGAEIENEFNELQTLLASSPSQLRNLAQLKTLIRRKMSMLQQSIEVYRQGGLADIVNISRVTDERSTMDEIRLQVVIMTREQNEALAAGSAAFYQEYQKAVMLGIGINALAILVLVMFYQLVRRSFQNRTAVEFALQNANDTLESTVNKRTEQLSVLSRHLISVNEVEKARLARELHDELGANLTAISMDLGAVTQQLTHTAPELAAQLRRAKATLLETVELKRRIVEDLRPSLLDNLGLCAAIESYCEDFSRMSEVRCETDVAINIDNREATLTIALFRIVQESLTNIMKYARAGAVSVTLKRNERGLVLRVIDDGIGIAEDALQKPMSHGLLGMRERALLLGGTLTVRPGPDGKGTCVEALIPMALAPEQSGTGESAYAGEKLDA
ncbi:MULTISPECIES: CHASE3 domain-containing protein [unclassified Janthinobacterium]|uniref:sensor histidine kinase n=1 Tax=unclassified Janthinobacterium TaxID=2610881 RepID=UPI00160E8ECA|nr:MULTISPECIES: CHASE3 domain-containing protein [unclassified Janthinobacterium]MBB5368767.1 signal transduction histidine kinase [Janthinobacterium sp. K2C7]MBB5381697.1 signal transduction histidine kinase [Janthinobacterium sp. K2Li3]MBB5387149.1 signal transduction histidine kinase [Janthinobacterium sp. K2E3]